MTIAQAKTEYDNPSDILADATAAFEIPLPVEGKGWLVVGLADKGSTHVLYQLDGSLLLDEITSKRRLNEMLAKTGERVV